MTRSNAAILAVALVITATQTFAAEEQRAPREYQPSAQEQKQSPDLRDAFGWLGTKIKQVFKRDQEQQELPAPPPAGPTPNLSGVVTEASVAANTLRFTVVIKNTGTVAARSDSRKPLRIKPFLLPEAAGKDGIVLDTADFAVDL